MADETDNQSQDQPNAELEREKREKQNVIETLRKRDAKIRQQDESITALQERLDRLERDRRDPDTQTAKPTQFRGDEAEPDFDSDPKLWFKWSNARQEFLRNQERQQNDLSSLNTFAITSEQLARKEVPQYDEAIEYIRKSYRAELTKTGELQYTAKQAMADPNQKAAISQRMAEKGLSEFDAAMDLCADAAFEWRRQRMVLSQRDLGGNPALAAIEMAKDRGWAPGTQYKGAGLGPDSNDKGSTTALADDALKELERRKNLRKAGETTADVREGGEPREKRAWTRAQLDELEKTNKGEWHRALKEIADDSDSAPGMLQNIITR